MAASLSRLTNYIEEDEYIEMELNLYSNFFCNSSIDIEFQMASSSIKTEPPTKSPADELFYKGKLLPLHLKHSTNSVYEDLYWTPLTTPPFDSCNVSPSSESHQISPELNPEECGENHRKRSPSAAAAIGSKLKAYRAYLKSLFNKSSCSSESCSASRVADEGSMLKGKDRLDRSMMMESKQKAPLGQIKHRRSSSSAIKRQHSRNKSSCSSTSSPSGSSLSSVSQSSNGVEYLQFPKQSNSVNVEIESPIQGAIAHCKKSQQLTRSSKIVSEVRLNLASTDLDMQHGYEDMYSRVCS